MPVDHDNKFFFVHIPKTAGISIASSLGLSFDGHKPFSNYQARLEEDYKSFAVVRNPYDRFISNYFYVFQKNEKGLPKSQYRSNRHPDLDTLQGKSIKECINMLKNEPQKLRLEIWQPQHYFICLNNVILVDRILKYESLKHNFKKICKLWNLGYHELITDNKTDHTHYDDYLDKNDKKFIYEFYKKDFEIFDYKK